MGSKFVGKERFKSNSKHLRRIKRYDFEWNMTSLRIITEKLEITIWRDHSKDISLFLGNPSPSIYFDLIIIESAIIIAIPIIHEH